MPKPASPTAKLTATQRKVVDILTDLLIIDENEVTPGSSLREDLGADSLDMVEIVMSLEERFKIEISDEDAEKIVRVEDIYKYLDKKGVK